MMSYISSLPDATFAARSPRSLAVMGSTGSIGTRALAVVDAMPDSFTITALAAGRNIRLLAEQASRYRPPYLAVMDEDAANALTRLLPAGYHPRIETGPQGYAALVALEETDVVLSAQAGAAGLVATEAAARAGKIIALANKESLVLAGALLRSLCAASGAVILPVDSEHNAIFHCLRGRDFSLARRVLLTASGGPFRGKNADYLRTVTPAQALAHPNWRMGAKISIDSATMMNKGLEIIEACHLYGLPLEAVEVLVHPQSLIHSLVEFTDGSLLAQCSTPDMRLPLASCLDWPRMPNPGVPRLDLTCMPALTFELPDISLFPCLSLAKQAQADGGGLPVVLNAANEVAVELFLEQRIAFTDIPVLVSRALETHNGHCPQEMEEILALDRETRRRLTALYP
jgi:1-deoxy-D-xylulose-5-phosphate reductoisomerase